MYTLLGAGAIGLVMCLLVYIPYRICLWIVERIGM